MRQTQHFEQNRDQFAARAGPVRIAEFPDDPPVRIHFERTTVLGLRDQRVPPGEPLAGTERLGKEFLAGTAAELPDNALRGGTERIAFDHPRPISPQPRVVEHQE
ncbi:MAG TPA: hypothetical protein VN851_28730, partial [Thermoanaerobaculia bacterium]|nr:hypothetical protein [Thermoanaerobaculia bacterium]